MRLNSSQRPRVSTSVICLRSKWDLLITSRRPANEIISKIEEAATPLGFDMKLLGEKTGLKGHLAVATEIFEVAPSPYMVELRKSGVDTLEFHKFYKNLSVGLKDIVWKSGDEAKEEESNASSTSASTVPLKLLQTLSNCRPITCYRYQLLVKKVFQLFWFA